MIKNKNFWLLLVSFYTYVCTTNFITFHIHCNNRAIVARVIITIAITWHSYRKVKPPSDKEVLEALNVPRRAVHHRVNNFNVQYESEQYVPEY